MPILYASMKYWRILIWQLSVLLYCAAIFAVSNARSTGAPTTACDGLTPLPPSPHVANGIMEQQTPNPWTIDICHFDEIMGFYTYTPGRTYNSKLIMKMIKMSACVKLASYNNIILS